MDQIFSYKIITFDGLEETPAQNRSKISTLSLKNNKEPTLDLISRLSNIKLTEISYHQTTNFIFISQKISELSLVSQPSTIQKKLWQIASRSLSTAFTSNDSSLSLKEGLSGALQNYILQCNDKIHIELPFDKHIVKDLQSKLLCTFRDKYFESKYSGSLENTPWMEDLLKFFSGEEKFGCKINTFLDNELKNIETMLLSQSEQKPVNRNEMLRLLVFLENIKRQEKGGDFECYVLDVDELEQFVKIAKDSISQDIEKRIQIIVRNDVHYSALDLELHHESSRCLVMDGALDPKYMDIINILNSQSFKVYASGKDKNECKQDKKENIQKDMFNCSTFAFDQLSHSSKMSNLFETLNKLPKLDDSDGTSYIAWKEFPVTLIKNAQSISFFQKNRDLTEVVERDVTLSKHIESNLRDAIDPVTFQSRKELGTINNKFSHYVEKVKKCIKSIEKSVLIHIVGDYPTNQFMQKNSQNHKIKIRQ